MILYCIRDAWTTPNYQGNLLSPHSPVEVRFFCCLFGISLMSGGGAKRQSLSLLSSSEVGGATKLCRWSGKVFTFLRTSVCLCTCPFHGVQKLSVLLIGGSSERLVNIFFGIFCVSLKDFICYLVEYFVWCWASFFCGLRCHNGLRGYESGSNFKWHKLVAAEVSVDIILEFSLSHLSLYFG